ncbi:hypothetical protein P4W15_16340 [Morganella morganii]|nr:hypothetical protein [Morganella morganii]
MVTSTKRPKKKLIRKLYDEIKDIDRRANFKNAYIAGMILNVLGLKTEPNYFFRKDKELIFIQKITQKIIKENFTRIVKDQPQVADSMLPKNITFDQDKNCLIKTYSAGIKKRSTKRISLFRLSYHKLSLCYHYWIINIPSLAGGFLCTKR